MCFDEGDQTREKHGKKIKCQTALVLLNQEHTSDCEYNGRKFRPRRNHDLTLCMFLSRLLTSIEAHSDDPLQVMFCERDPPCTYRIGGESVFI